MYFIRRKETQGSYFRKGITFSRSNTQGNFLERFLSKYGVRHVMP